MLNAKISRWSWFMMGFIVVVLAASATVIVAQESWGYGEDNGPAEWGSISPDYALCGEGASQSPIDIVDATATTLTPIEFSYEEVPLAIFNNGHTIEVEY